MFESWIFAFYAKYVTVFASLKRSITEISHFRDEATSIKLDPFQKHQVSAQKWKIP